MDKSQKSEVRCAHGAGRRSPSLASSRLSQCILNLCTQICVLKLESWSHTSVELSLEWKRDDVVIKEKSETMNQHDFAVELNSNVGGQYQSFGGNKSVLLTI